MELIDLIRNNRDISSVEETSGYYYTQHTCATTGESKRVKLDYTLSSDLDDRIIRFGICEDCGKCYYHKDYESKMF
jgi:hypothetical protein